MDSTQMKRILESTAYVFRYLHTKVSVFVKCSKITCIFEAENL